MRCSPAPRSRDEAGEDGDGQQWRLGPIDLERGVVEVHRAPDAEPATREPRPTRPRSRECRAVFRHGAALTGGVSRG